MKITLPASPSATSPKDLLIAGAFTQKPSKTKSKTFFQACANIIKLDQQIDGHLITSAHDEGFRAQEGESYVTSTLGKSHSKSFALIGLGDSHEQSVDLFRRSGGLAYQIAQKKRAKKISYVVPEDTTLPLYDVTQAISEGLKLASYNFGRYQTKDKKENHVQEVEIILPKKQSTQEQQAISHAAALCEGVTWARDLINEGPMELNPKKFASIAEKLAQDYNLSCNILDEKHLKHENMGMMLAVASAAQNISPPRLIRLEYKPAKASKKTIALIGKGVTFDSGGLDIKPANSMLEMKIDMSGAASVLGTMIAIAKLKPRVSVIGYLACVENGIGPHAYHPGDILTSKKGLTVEVANTDAEGRLVLADTITYAQKEDSPDIIIDIATLTGACMVALGLKTAGVFTNQDTLSSEIISCGAMAGESFWRLPLSSDLKESIKSQVADIKNCGDRWGGAITAALFLEEFIDKDVHWAHLDIAGPASNNKPQAYIPAGGAGFAVRTLANFIMGQD